MASLTIHQAWELAVWHRQAGRPDDAERLCRQILAVDPGHPDALIMLGAMAAQAGRLDIAEELIRQAVIRRPEFPEAWSNLGNVLAMGGRLDDAIAAFRKAVSIQCDSPIVQYNLGLALQQAGKVDEAIVAFRQAVGLDPRLAEAHNNLGIALKDRMQFDEAIAAFRQIIRLKPGDCMARYNLGSALKEVGQLDEAIACFQQAVALDPNDQNAHGNLLLGLHYHPRQDAETIAREHRAWSQRHAAPLGKLIQAHSNDRAPDRRLKVGYVSPDLRFHPVGRFLLPLLANHDHTNFEIHAYPLASQADSLTGELRGHADQWRSLAGLSDGQAADLIRRDRIDILVDLAGHTAMNRVMIFARKPAPVQVTYLGYPNTTGLAAMDYRLTDAYADPPGQTERHHSEELIRLPGCAWCFQPAVCPPIESRTYGPFTFGCFNTFAKITEPMLRVWGGILRSVPDSRLVLKSPGSASASARARVVNILGASGIEPEQIVLREYTAEYGGHLASYGQIDIALDTFPYYGTTTTCEALWMGVPVITLSGPSHAARVGVSLLSNIGLPELIAGNDREYARLALELAGDRPRLQQMRSTLRHRMQASPLMDGPGFARGVETAYRRMWRKWCGSVDVAR